MMHIDVWDKLIRYGLVVHGCIDGFSRRICGLRLEDQTMIDIKLLTISVEWYWD